MTETWQPPYSLEERLKYALIPPRLYLRHLARRALRHGERELRLLPQLTAPNKTAIDIGANKGIYTYLLAELSATVVAFEPNPKMFRILQRGLPANAEAHQVALSDRPGAADLVLPGRGGRYSNQRGSLVAGGAPNQSSAIVPGTVSVEARTLDSYAPRNVGFIKIDVEGHEREVLQGSLETIARERPVLLIEIEQKHTNRPIEDDLDFVESLGYDGYFAVDDAVQNISAFDADTQHRQVAKPGGYVFNFIFLPKGTDPMGLFQQAGNGG